MIILDIVAGRTISFSANAVTEMGPRLSMTDSALKRSGVMPFGSSIVRSCRVKRADDKTDGRGVLVSTTSKGRRTFQRAQEQRLHHFAEVLESLSGEQLSAMRSLTGALERLTALLDKNS